MSWKAVSSPARVPGPVFSSKKSSLQLYIDSQKHSKPIVGLEYIVEIHSLEAGRDTRYRCLLCGENIEGMNRIIQHLHKLSHKLHYLQDHFSLIKEQRLKTNNITHESVDRIVEKIEAYFGRLEARLVVGENTFTANETFITESVKGGKHFEEDSRFLSYLIKELPSRGRRRRRRSSSSDDSRGASRKKQKKDRRRSREKRKSRDKSDKRSRSRDRRSLVSVSQSPGHSSSHVSRDPRRHKDRGSGRKKSRSPSVGIVGHWKGRGESDEDDDGDIQILEDSSEREIEEAAAVKQLEEERDMFVEHPNQHPKYKRMWNDFWHKKRKELSGRGVDISQVDLTPEWSDVWTDFITEETRRKISAKRSELEQKYQGKSEIIHLSEEDSQEDTVEVLNLLNLLSQLNSNHLLSLEDKVSQLRERAFNMEAEKYSSCQRLLDDEQCFNLMDQAEETLKLRLKERKVAEVDYPVVKIALQQISIFLRLSSCQKSDILELESVAPGQQEDSRILRMSISKTIAKELEKSGRRVSEGELSTLVEAEFVRVKHRMSSKEYSKLFNLKPSASASQPGEKDLFSVYGAGTVKHGGRQHSSIGQYSSTVPEHSSIGQYSSTVPEHSTTGLYSNTTTRQPDIDWTNVMKGVNSIQRDKVISSRARVQHPPVILNTFQNPPPQRNKPPAEDEQLSDGELTALMENFDQLNAQEKQILIACVGELEAVDPRKAERIKRRLYQRR